MLEPLRTCPSAPRADPGYAYFGALGGRRLDDVPRPAEVYAFWDADAKGPAFRHHSGLNVGFVDGHAYWVSPRWVLSTALQGFARDIDRSGTAHR